MNESWEGGIYNHWVSRELTERLPRVTKGADLGVNIYGGSLSLCQSATKLKQEGGA